MISGISNSSQSTYANKHERRKQRMENKPSNEKQEQKTECQIWNLNEG